MFKYLAIDWGSKRCGLAFGEEESGMILPASYECQTKNIFKIIKQEIVDKKLSYIVLGLPKNFHNRPTRITESVERFREELITLFPEIKLELIQENLTTKIAKAQGIADRTLINHLAACEILKTYFYKLELRTKK